MVRYSCCVSVVTAFNQTHQLLNFLILLNQENALMPIQIQKNWNGIQNHVHGNVKTIPYSIHHIHLVPRLKNPSNPVKTKGYANHPHVNAVEHMKLAPVLFWKLYKRLLI